MGDVDAALSVWALRQEREDWTRPTFLPPGQAARIRDLRHPLVEDAVANSIDLEPGRGILITGSNMSGKSTFLRTVGVTAVMAQTLHTCFASSYDAPVFSVQSCIGRSDDLIAGKSYYLVEVEEVLARVRASADSRPHLFMFDELFRGTNAVERIAAGEAVLREIVERKGQRTPHVVLAATHDGELVDLLADAFAPYHFADSVGAEGLIFHYRLEPGAATTRNAIALLQLQGAPESLTTAALARAAALDRQRTTLRDSPHQ
jgi:DNA mismatch repair ATPase MutS